MGRVVWFGGVGAAGPRKRWRASFTAAARSGGVASRGRGRATGISAQAGAASRLAPTRCRASPPLRKGCIQPRAKGAGPASGAALAAALWPTPAPAARKGCPKTKDAAKGCAVRRRSSPSNERLPPNTTRCQSKRDHLHAIEQTRGRNRWPSSQQLEPRAPRPSRGAAACRPVHLMSY